MAEIAKYLLPSERHALEVRHHWAALSGYAGTAAAFWAGGLLALYLFIDVALLRATFVFFLLFTVAWFLWMVGEWYLERFVVTDRRVLLLTGILTKRVAIMPLAKVTDLTYERTITGRLLGYGVFVIESAGQQQALSRIAYIPHPDQLYQEVSGLLFGSQSGSDDGTGSTGGNAAGSSGAGNGGPPQPPSPPG
ncbi:MAG: bacterial domain protein, partial [Pseudonocardiales bacterium]|nr:bacterial domain protein [Pseudonocardiales bacterium]